MLRTGFWLHAGVAAEAQDSHKLERLCRSMARPAISEKRLSLSPQGTALSAQDAVEEWHHARGVTSGVLPFATRAGLRLFRFASGEFVEPIDFIAKRAALGPLPGIGEKWPRTAPLPRPRKAEIPRSDVRIGAQAAPKQRPSRPWCGQRLRARLPIKGFEPNFLSLRSGSKHLRFDASPITRHSRHARSAPAAVAAALTLRSKLNMAVDPGSVPNERQSRTSDGSFGRDARFAQQGGVAGSRLQSNLFENINALGRSGLPAAPGCVLVTRR